MNKTVIIGGGVVGLFTAFYLQKRGVEVTLIDRGDLTDGCSFGNAGLIVPSHVIPLASPAMLRKGIRNLFRPSSPVTANLMPDPGLIRWYMKFAGASNPDHVQESIPVLRDLSLLSKSLYGQIKQSGELNFPMWHKGLLMLYQSHKTGEELLEEAKIARQAGLDVTELSATGVRELEPQALPKVSGGVHYHSDDHLDPSFLMQSLIAHLESAGVNIIRNNAVTGIRISGNKAVSLETEKGLFTFDKLVITAGMWSPQVMQPLKMKIALQPGKGYSFKVKTNSLIHYPALLSDVNVAVTPLGNGITQFGGGMELGYADTKIRHARVNHIIKAVGEFYPSEKDLQITPEQIWQGHRPCSFDGLPFIGRIKHCPDVFVGTGHSMMGLTLAPATGLLLSELISENKTTLNLHPFRLER
jgi:D-amino-acid dehydrogenase